MFYNYFIYFLLIFLYEQLIAGLVLSRNIDDKQHNIIWFMTEPLNSANLSAGISLKGLNFCKFVKPCTTESEETAPFDDDGEPKCDAKIKKRNACDCSKVLDKNIESFLNWVQVNKKMSTASVVINASKIPLNKNCPKKKLFKLPLSREMTPMAHHKKGNKFTNKYKIIKSQKQHLKRDVNILDVPVYELFNPEPNLIFNEIDRPENEELLFKDLYHDVNARNAVTILTQNDDGIYEDNAKNVVELFDKKKVQSCPPKMPKTSSDLRKSNFVQSQGDFNLFRMVVNTIDQLIAIGNPEGFVAIIKGGRLQELEDEKSSALARSIDYAICKTNESDTLVVLSTLCPENKTIDDKGRTVEDQLPVFCTGPHCADLDEAEELKDLFDIMKRNLEDSAQSENNCRNDLAPSEGRLARALIETVYYDQNYQRNSLKHKNKMKRSIEDGGKAERFIKDICSGGELNKIIFWELILVGEIIFGFVYLCF